MRVSVQRKNKYPDSSVNYLATVSDLMSGLLFVFILALVVAMLNIADTNSQMQETNRKLGGIIDTYKGNNDARHRLLLKIKNGVYQRSNGRLLLEVDPNNGILRIPESAVTFKSSQSKLDDENKDNVKLIGEVLYNELFCFQKENHGLRKCQRVNAAKRTLDAIFIEGHTDNIKYKEDVSDHLNRDLSTRRSNEVYLEMVYKNENLRGMKNSRNEQLFSLSGYGSERPLHEYRVPTPDAANRRIELRMIFTPPSEADRIRVLKENRSFVSEGRTR